MNPYRDAPAVAVADDGARKKSNLSLRQQVCFTIVIATIAPTIAWSAAMDPKNHVDCAVDLARFAWIPWLAPLGLIALIIGILPAANNDAKARLCRILWHCGDRGTAFGVYIGWIPLRLSRKRMDRNARAVQRFVQQRRRERYPWIKS